MPKINWEKIAEIKHALAEERTIICGTIERLKRLDIRLGLLEKQLVDLIEEADDGNKK